MNGAATRKALAAAANATWRNLEKHYEPLHGTPAEKLESTYPNVHLGPESFGLPRPRDPHDVEGRKWFRRTIITLFIAAFLVISVPDIVRTLLNKWAGTPMPAKAVSMPQPSAGIETCTTLKLYNTRFTYADCHVKDKRGRIVYHREGM